MPLYIETVSAATETATKILARRTERHRAPWHVTTTTNGGSTATVSWAHPTVTLNLPSLPPDAILTRAEADRLVAYIAHECCHVLHTDWDAWKTAVNAGPRVAHWTNALEDVRIEGKEIKAGAFPALRDLLASLCTQKHYEAATKAGRSKHVIGSTISDAPYAACILGRMRNKYAIPTAAPLAGTLSADVRHLIDHALTRLPQCRDTFAVYRLAEELTAMERTMAPPPQPPQPPQPPGADGQDGPGADGQDGPGADDQDGPGEAQEGADGQDAPDGSQEGADGSQDGPGEAQEGADGQDGPGEAQEGADGQDGPGEAQEGADGRDGPGEAQEGADGRDGPGEDINPNHELASLVKAVAERTGLGDISANADKSHILNTARARIERNRYPTDAWTASRMASALNARLPGNSVLHGQISRLLVSDEVHRHTHHETAGRLDRRALVRMRTGATDVFTRRDDTPGIDTALLILLDQSGSMRMDAGAGTSRMQLAQVATWHIAKAAEDANAKVCVASFRTPAEIARQRTEGADIWIVKDWQDSTSDAAHALARLMGENFTPLSQSIIGAAEYLRDVSATRYILLVITDGVCDLGAKAVTAACNIAAHMGVETVGLGMACEEIAAAFPPGYSENIEDLAQLAATGMAVLTRMLEAGNPRGAD